MTAGFQASKIALLYAVVAGLWIWLSDAVLVRIVTVPERIALWQTYKGWGFVLLTAVLLWVERAWSEQRVYEIEMQLRSGMQARTTELERVRTQLQVLLDNAPIGFSMRSLDNRYLLTNRRWAEFMGVSSETALNKRPEDIFPPDVAAHVALALEQLWDKPSGIVEEIPVRLHGQDYVFLRASFPLFDEAGKPYAAIGLATDITATKAVEENLRQAEARFRAIFQTVGVGINLVAPSGHYIGANPAFQRMTGYAEAELVGRHFSEITYPPDLVEDEKVTKQIEARPSEIAETEKRYVRADGSWVWARLLISAIINQDGTLAMYVSVVEDITARKEAQAQQQCTQAELEGLVAARTAKLQRAHDELSEAQRLAHVGNWNIDLASNELEWSAETYQIFGYEPNAFLGSQQTFLSAVHPNDREFAEQVHQAALAGQPLDYEHRVIRPTGEVRVVHERGYVVHDAEGKAVRIFGTVQDITERKAAEEAIRAINVRLSAILEASPLGIVAMDAEGMINLWNPASEKIYGYLPHEALGKVVSASLGVWTDDNEEFRQRWCKGKGSLV